MKDGKQEGLDVCLTGLAGSMTAEERRSLPGPHLQIKNVYLFIWFSFFGKANPSVSRREAVKVRRGKSPPSKLTHATFFFFFFSLLCLLLHRWSRPERASDPLDGAQWVSR